MRRTLRFVIGICLITAGGDARAQNDFVRAADSALLLKVVGLSDNISIVDAPGSSTVVAKMETLKPYFVLDNSEDTYHVSARQEESAIQGYVARQEVARWNTREGLHFENDTFLQDRRASVSAWQTEERIRRYAETGDADAFGPTYREELQTRIGTRGIIPYPLLDTKEIKTLGGTKRIHQVLIPAIVAGGAETSLTPEEVQQVAGAVTICVVFDATGSMKKYARDFADTVDKILSELSIDTSLAAAGFVLFRDLGAQYQRFEIAHPMPLSDATVWLRRRTSQMVGGDDPAEPVLDAVTLAQNSFLWNGGTAIRGARRIAIVVANTDAKPETVALSEQVPAGLSDDDVARLLIRNGISVFALQAGREDKGNLRKVLSTLATETGGEFYAAEVGSDEISESFSQNLETLVSRPIQEGSALAARLKSEISARSRGGTVIPLNVLDDDVMERLKDAAQDFHIASGGLVITPAWVFEQPDLYREKILIDKELLEWLVRFFNTLTDSSFDTVSLLESMANLLEAMIGEDLSEAAELQELLEKRLGIHFTTNLLSFPLEHLATLGPRERVLLQERIRNATIALADFLDMNVHRYNKEPRLWMPVSYLP